MKKAIEISGKRFNRLTVIKRIYPNNRNNKVTWLCKCDCGNETIVSGADIRRGHTKSCGCLRNEKVGALNRLNSPEIATKRQVINGYKNHARERNLKYELTEKQFTEITKRNCFYCGAKPSNRIAPRSNNEEYIYNGIDRLDSNKSYTIDNVVTCCKFCNAAKRDLSLPEFKAWIEKVYRNMLK